MMKAMMTSNKEKKGEEVIALLMMCFGSLSRFGRLFSGGSTAGEAEGDVLFLRRPDRRVIRYGYYCCDGDYD
jgi:hypothetical protein